MHSLDNFGSFWWFRTLVQWFGLNPIVWIWDLYDFPQFQVGIDPMIGVFGGWWPSVHQEELVPHAWVYVLALHLMWHCMVLKLMMLYCVVEFIWLLRYLEYDNVGFMLWYFRLILLCLLLTSYIMIGINSPFLLECCLYVGNMQVIRSSP